MRYHQLGEIPQKRHVVFKDANGKHRYEQLFGTEGFSGVSSLLYHIHRPTQMLKFDEPIDVSPVAAIEKNITPRLVQGFKTKPTDDFLDARTALFFNNDLIMGVAAPRKSMTDYFYKNGQCDEMLFIHEGSGTLKTFLGDIPFEYGDYLIIPRGTIYQLEFETENNRILYLESFSPIETPRRYRNKYGQLLEHSPFCERDIKVPQYKAPIDEKGEFLIKVKKAGMIHPITYATHPFDVVGWDGYFYPYGFSIHNFEPITGRIHQPPPVHQNFEGNNFVICSFCPRLYDYHPDAVPAPYNHSNIDSEEVLYYVDGDFMSRNHIERGYFTLHPGGIPHGPHPGAMERSVGQKETGELAVMVDPFHPLKITQAALDLEDDSYKTSWLE
ncbi:MAG: homogentisate 1,2-dioxygenase [Flavobacteriaceae bacterium]|jgi:homogentisate 1,2-dioxygenase|nr:homogentisate 1,2-dioxygenase [Flavobacteriaceae bacterium]